MPETIVIIEYQLGDQQKTLPIERWREMAGHISTIPGLIWKYWLKAEGDHRGGAYLFSDRQHAEEGSSHLIDSLKAAGAINANRQLFDVDGELSAITRAFAQ